MIHKTRLRYRKLEDWRKVHAQPIIIHPSSPTAATFREVDSSHMKLKEKDGYPGLAKDKLDRTKGDRREFRFVRVGDRIFKVSQDGLLQVGSQEVATKSHPVQVKPKGAITRFFCLMSVMHSNCFQPM